MTHFEPLDPKEHQRGNAGYDVPDRCRNCRQPFTDHTNGVCPQSASDLERDAQREFLLCPECGKWVHTKPAEGVPAQALRACDECDAVFFMDLNAKPIYTKPEE